MTADSKRTGKKKTADATDPAVIARAYHNMLEGHPDGQAILADLLANFYDRTSVTNPVDPSATLVMEGERRVVLYILAKCAEGQK